MALIGTGVRSMMNMTWLPAATAYSIGVFIDASLAIYHYTDILPYVKNIREINEGRREYEQMVPVYDLKKPSPDSPIFQKSKKGMFTLV